MDFIGARIDRIEFEFAVTTRKDGAFDYLANLPQLD